MNVRTPSSSAEKDRDPLFPEERVTAVIIAVIAYAAICLAHSVLREKDDASPQSTPDASIKRPAESVKDNKIMHHREQLEEGDEGLHVVVKDDEVIFSYDFHLHPLAELPNDVGHSSRFEMFVRRWMENSNLEADEWIVLPVHISHEIQPESEFPVPNSIYHYHLKCTIIRKTRPGRLIA